MSCASYSRLFGSGAVLATIYQLTAIGQEIKPGK
jgi:hypothetical protein